MWLGLKKVVIFQNQIRNKQNLSSLTNYNKICGKYLLLRICVQSPHSIFSEPEESR